MKFIYQFDSIQPYDEEAAAYVANLQEGDMLELIESKRTGLQNKAMWVYCTKLAGALNAAGFDMRSFPFRDGLSIPWTKHSVMSVFWKPVQSASLGKESTRELNTKQVNQVYEAVDLAISQRTGVHVPFPCKEVA